MIFLMVTMKLKRGGERKEREQEGATKKKPLP
jgi:hypothetical protein